MYNVVKEYEEYCEFRFGKRPKLVRRATGDSAAIVTPARPNSASRRTGAAGMRPLALPRHVSTALFNDHSSAPQPEPITKRTEQKPRSAQQRQTPPPKGFFSLSVRIHD